MRVNPACGSWRVSKKVQESVTGPVLDRPASPGGEDPALDTSCEPPSPLQIQVKSKVVVPGQQAVPARSGARSLIFNDDLDWEGEKRNYIHMVSSHMCEKRAADQGVMCELQSLMSRVADRSDESGPWQHPSDFTRRNYQRRFGNETPKISLNDWQKKNLKNCQRFASVPEVLKKSPCP